MRTLSVEETEVVSGGYLVVQDPYKDPFSDQNMMNNLLRHFMQQDGGGFGFSTEGGELDEVVITASREVVTIEEVLTWAAAICAVATAIYAAPILVAGVAGTAAAAWAYGLASAGFGALAAYLAYIDGKP